MHQDRHVLFFIVLSIRFGSRHIVHWPWRVVRQACAVDVEDGRTYYNYVSYLARRRAWRHAGAPWRSPSTLGAPWRSHRYTGRGVAQSWYTGRAVAQSPVHWARCGVALVSWARIGGRPARSLYKIHTQPARCCCGAGAPITCLLWRGGGGSGSSGSEGVLRRGPRS